MLSHVNVEVQFFSGIEYERELAGLRAGLDENTFNLHWAEGQSMNMEQAIEYALKQDIA